jgi:hypothetical protein
LSDFAAFSLLSCFLSDLPEDKTVLCGVCDPALLVKRKPVPGEALLFLFTENKNVNIHLHSGKSMYPVFCGMLNFVVWCSVVWCGMV